MGFSAKPLKILHVINALELGGAETLLYRLVTCNSANQHIVVSLGSPDWYSSALQEKGIVVHHLGMDSLFTVPGALLRLNSIVRRSDADVVQCWMYRSNLVGGLVARLAGKPVVWGIHCSSVEELRPSSRALARLAGALARWIPSFVINCSTRSVEVHRKLGYSAVEGAVVHNGYDPALFLPDEQSRLATREALDVKPSEFMIGSISRWDRQKDIPNLLAGLSLARRRGVPFRCFLFGATLDTRNGELMQAIGRADCSDVVVPIGPRPDIADICRALDLHVLASAAEAFPNTVSETMLSGTPNVVTAVGDCASIVGDSGWIVPPRDPEQLADAIVEAFEEWRDNPSAWAARRSAARTQIADNFSADRMAAGYEEAWARVLGGKTVRASKGTSSRIASAAHGGQR